MSDDLIPVHEAMAEILRLVHSAPATVSSEAEQTSAKIRDHLAKSGVVVTRDVCLAAAWGIAVGLHATERSNVAEAMAGLAVLMEST